MDGGSRVLPTACGELAGVGFASDAVMIGVKFWPVSGLANPHRRSTRCLRVGAISVDHRGAVGRCGA